MKVSREKALRLSHQVLKYLNEDDGVEFFADPQEIRQEIFRMIEAETKADGAMKKLDKATDKEDPLVEKINKFCGAA